MGVPAFFRWLCCRNPKILWDVQENPDDLSALTSNPQVDNLYLDMNGIIHPCSHPEVSGIPIPVTLNDMFVNVFNYVDRLVDLIRPGKLIYMAIDGVAPRAKMNQQRARRFRAAQESERASDQKRQLRDYWLSQGMHHPALDEYLQNSFDSNQITPGTEFMEQLTIALQYYIYERLNNNPLFEHLVIIFSDASVPGEGEHKILQFIRDQRCEEGYNPNTRHCLYGADADLIMLGLSTHEPWFYIIRETFVQNDDKFCSLCSQKGHYFTDCKSRTTQDEDNDYQNEVDIKVEKVRTLCINFQMVRIHVMREWLWLELAQIPKGQMTFQLDLERIVDDFVFMCFLVGNDFLPHIPALRITDGGIDCLIMLYKILLPKFQKYLTNCGDVDLQVLDEFLKSVGSIEDELLKGQQKKLEFSRQRREQEQSYQPAGVKTDLTTGQVMVGMDSQGILENFKAQLKEKLQHANQAEMSAAQIYKDGDQLKQWNVLSLRQRYYTEKFHIEPKHFLEFKDRLRQSYIESLAWTLKYYYNGCVDWGWYYPFHYAPFAQDLGHCNFIKIDFNQANQPFLPYQQLLGVLPPRSKQFLPETFHDLMLNKESPIADFYPIDFFVDLKGKKFAWLGEVVLPFIDADRLIVAHDVQVEKGEMSRPEVNRNKRGNELLFFNAKFHATENVVSPQERPSSIMKGLTVKIWERFPLGGVVKSPIPTFVDVPANQVMSQLILKTTLQRKKNFVQNAILPGCIQPNLLLDEHYMKECENNKRSFGGEAVKRIIQTALNIRPTYNNQQHGGYNQRGRGGYNDNHNNNRNNYNRNNDNNRNYNQRGNDRNNGSNYQRRGMDLQELDQTRKQIKKDI